MKKISLAILLLLLCTSLLFAQQIKTGEVPDKKNQIGVFFGIDQGLVKDVNYSPLNYIEGGNLYKVDYQRGSPNVKFSVQTIYSTGTIQTDASSFFETAYQQGFLGVDFWKKIKLSNKKKYTLNWGVGYHFYIYYLEWGDLDAYSFLANHSVNLSTSFHRNLSEKHSLQAQLSVPLVNFLVRPPYAALDEELSANQDKPLKLISNGSLASLNKLIEYALEINYVYSLTDRLGLQASYANRYQNVSGLKQMKHFQHQLSIGTTFKF